jgi:L-threonylcarbamoyladenylate synthase
MNNIAKAAEFIRSGKLVAFPTETVYGLGADATNEQACQKIFTIKGRPRINPLIIHVANIEQAESVGEFNADARRLANSFWPGPLSIIVPLSNKMSIASSVLAGLTTVALRIPAHNRALELITASGASVAAPSANPSGYVSATTLEHVKEHFSNESEIFILSDDLGKSQYGIESTIIDSTTSDFTILRSGFITLESLEKILGKKINNAPSLMQIKAPGMMDKHYSPKVTVRLNANDLRVNELGLNFANSKLESRFSLNLSLTGDLIEAASNLYLSLRALDNYAELTNNISGIAVAPIPDIAIGVAINDRLKRAAK